MLVRRPYGTSLETMEPPDGRSISVDIGPFEDQADLLHFAMLLETEPGVGHIDLIEAEPENALFIVRGESAGAVAALLNRLPDYRITSTAFGNMVAAKIDDRERRAAILFAPPVAVGAASAAAAAAAVGTYTEPVYTAAATGPAWWRRATLAVAMGAAAAGLFFIALNGVPSWPGGSTVRPSPTVAVAVPTTFVPPSATATPVLVVPTAAAPKATAGTPVAPSPTASPVPTASATPSPTPSPTPTATPVPAVSSRYFASFSTSLGTIRALNACVWDTPVDGALVLNLTRDADGNVSGGATMEGLLTYVVTEIPGGSTTCRPAETEIVANGWAAGGNAVSASMTGARDLVVSFDGTMQGGSVVGDLTIRRDLSTTSSFGDTNETRSAVVRGLTLVPTN